MVNNLSIQKSFIICRIYLMLIIVLTFDNKISFADDSCYKDFSGNSVSIFFIIDHSGSMFEEYDPSVDPDAPYDRWGNRFIVPYDLIDSLYKNYPKTEIGIAVFRQWLYFFQDDDTIFANYPGEDYWGYIPLLHLDSVYTPPGKIGYEILKEYLETDTATLEYPPYWEYVDLEYIPTDINLNAVYTNINAGFFAAKHAMLSSQYPAEEHFIIFFSDGVASWPEDGTQDDYIQGDSVPTTFTIFFTKDNTVPQSLQDMTENIQANGYSLSNSISNLWANESDYDNLLHLIKDTILAEILDPTHIDLSNDNYTNKNFVFINSLNAKTIINYTINDNSNIILDIFNLHGRKVCSLVNDFKKAGSHQAVWDGTDKSGVQVSNGCYIIRFVCDKQKITKSFILTL